MEVVQTCPDVRYWSEALCCTKSTHMNDLEVKVIDLEKKYMLKFWLKFLEAKRDSGKLRCPVTTRIRKKTKS